VSITIRGGLKIFQALLSALAWNFGDVWPVITRRGPGLVRGRRALEQEIEVRLRELPLERGGDLLVVALEGQQSDFYLSGAAEVVWVRSVRWMTEK
jgi:hypothetical protein